MKKYDLHTHFIPKALLEFLSQRTQEPRFAEESPGQGYIVHGGAKFGPLSPVMYDPELRLKDVDAIDQEMVQVLSVTIPGVDFLDTEGNLKLARLINDGLAEISRRYLNRFLAIGVIPFTAGKAAIFELERLVNEKGLKGIITYTNIEGEPLDSPRFFPIYEKSQELNIPILVHPTVPPSLANMAEYRLVALVGFEHELTLAMARIIYAGLLERFPGLKFVFSHLGGTYPFIADRIDRGWHHYAFCRKNISHPPSWYLKKIYMDTVSFYGPALRCALEVFGPDNLVLGSDHPFPIGDLPGSITSIEALNISTQEKEKILYGNAKNLLGV